MKRGIEQGSTPIDLTEIRTNFREIAKDMDPNSQSMVEVREAREQADRRLADSGIIVIL